MSNEQAATDTEPQTIEPRTTPADEPEPRDEAQVERDAAIEKARDEAVKYRQRLRSTETERDQLAAQLEAAKELNRQMREQLRLRHRADVIDKLVGTSFSVRQFMDPDAARHLLDRLDDDALDGMLDPDEKGHGSPFDKGVNRKAMAEWSKKVLEEYPWAKRRRGFGEMQAMHSVQLAENPQGEYRPQGDPLRNALHR